MKKTVLIIVSILIVIVISILGYKLHIKHLIAKDEISYAKFLETAKFNKNFEKYDRLDIEYNTDDVNTLIDEVYNSNTNKSNTDYKYITIPDVSLQFKDKIYEMKSTYDVKQLKEIIEKEVVKEVIPENLILEKQELEEELKTLRARAEKAENTISRMKLDKEIHQDKVYSNVKLDNLLINIKTFLDNASKYTYLKEELQKIPTQNRKILESKINEVESWTILMKQALRNENNMVGNVIFGEGEIINE